MNHRVRDYLVQVARERDKFVYYSDLVKDCGLDLDLSTNSGRKELSTILGEVSAFENSQPEPRPMLSALTIYKSNEEQDHGNGFYNLAEELGKGKAKKLKDELFGFIEAQAARDFWQNEDNFQRYASPRGETQENEGIAFFDTSELEHFKAWQSKPYDPYDEGHIKAKNRIMDTVWEKSLYLGQKIAVRLSGFEVEGKKVWSQRGWRVNAEGENVPAALFKCYTWVKVFPKEHKGKNIFFTFGINASPDSESFLYKIDSQNQSYSKLSADQIELCDSLIPESAYWNEIPFSDLVKENWGSLTEVCVQFIKDHEQAYHSIVRAVWDGQALPPSLFKNKLVRRPRPKEGLESIPDRNREFKGVDIDYSKKSKEHKDLGDAGEKLVRQYEIEFLRSSGMDDEAERVEIVQDGKGYDVLSFDLEGSEKYIEVKTTPGGASTPFYLSENELAYMRSREGRYVIYRVYNFDAEHNFGEFYELSGNVDKQVLLEPIRYRVLLKQL